MINNDILGMINNPFSKLLPETTNINNDILRVSTPQQLFNYYKLGQIKGIILDTEKSPWYARKYAKYNFEYLKDNQEDNEPIILEDTSFYNQIRGSSKGLRVLNFTNYHKIDPGKASVGAQKTGDCVSWAIRDSLDQLRCNKIAAGAWEAYIIRQATCGIYSGRGHTGQGADPVGLSSFAVKIGTLLEKTYQTSNGNYDFSDYNSYVNWGMSRGRSGVPADLLEFTKPYTAGGYKVVATTDALADLIAAGGTAHCGSDIGVASNGNPISRRSGSWSHDMNIVGFDDTDWCHQKFGGRIWIWNQSWGNWNSVSNIPDEWKPWGQGQFALSDDDTQFAVRDGGTVVFYDGKWFNAEPITNEII